MKDDRPQTEAARAMEEERIGRRSFLSRLAGVGGVAWMAAMAYGAMAYLNAPPSNEKQVNEVDLGNPDRFKPNSITKIALGTTPAFLIVDDDGEFDAVSAVCTHLGCIVHINAENNGFACPCHGGQYNIDGLNVGGPPPKPLEKFRVAVRKNSLWVVRA